MEDKIWKGKKRREVVSLRRFWLNDIHFSRFFFSLVLTACILKISEFFWTYHWFFMKAYAVVGTMLFGNILEIFLYSYLLAHLAEGQHWNRGLLVGVHRLCSSFNKISRCKACCRGRS